MRTIALPLGIYCVVASLVGCVATPTAVTPMMVSSVAAREDVETAQPVAEDPKLHSSPAVKASENLDFIALPSDSIGLSQAIQLALEQNPRLSQIGWAIEAARGNAVQAGLYPNPVTSVNGNEIGDSTGPDGIWSVFVGQEIVTANKLGLEHAVAAKEVDQATLKLVSERYELLTEVRKAYFDALSLQRRAEILAELVKLAEQSTENANTLLKVKEAAELDVIQLEVDLERYRADYEATQRSLPAAYEKVASTIGVKDLQISRLEGTIDSTVPKYELEQVKKYVLGIHPDIRSAQAGSDKAKLAFQRAEVEPIPNVTVGAGYTYQGQNRSNDWDIGFSVPLPVWDRNQGNISAAKAMVYAAENATERARNEIVTRVTAAFAIYASARERSERYKAQILPRAERSLQLSQAAYQGGQFEYLRVLEAQRASAEAQLELLRSLGETWQAASEIAGLMLEDEWPLKASALPLEGSE